MVVFGVIIEKDPIELMRGVDIRINLNSLVKSPFTGGVKRWGEKFYLVNLKPIYPNPSIIGWVFLIINFLTFNVWWAYIPSGLLIITSFFWSRWFFFILLYIMVRKANYEGSIKLLTDQKTLGRLEEWGK